MKKSKNKVDNQEAFKNEIEQLNGKVFTFINDEFTKLVDQLNKKMEAQSNSQIVFANAITNAIKKITEAFDKDTRVLNNNLKNMDNDLIIFNSAILALMNILEEKGICTVDDYKKRSTEIYKAKLLEIQELAKQQEEKKEEPNPEVK